MLRQLKISKPWRSLDSSTWPKDVHCGKGTFIYGHNGSGKSTIAELLLALGERDANIIDDAPDKISWVSEKGQTTQFRRSDTPPEKIAVFTRKWVNKNLNSFLEGEGGQAIVTLGSAAVEAAEQEQSLRTEIKAQDKVRKDAHERRIAFETRINELVSTVQDNVISELKKFDPDFKKRTFTVNEVKRYLERTTTPPSEKEKEDAVHQLDSAKPSSITVPELPDFQFGSLKESITIVLKENPSKVLIQELAENPGYQQWVRQGLELHEERSECIFCANKISEARLELLKQQFDDEWERVSQTAKDLRSHILKRQEDLENFLRNLPAPEQMVLQLKSEYQEELNQLLKVLPFHLRELKEIGDVLKSKASDPTKSFLMPDCTALDKKLSTAKLLSLIRHHNQDVDDYLGVLRACKETVKHYYVHQVLQEYQDAIKKQADYEEIESKAGDAQTDLERCLEASLQKRFSSKKMADTLTTDLARVYGRSHLKIIVADDGKSYRCYRDGAPATNLSEGEQTTLALLYFLRSLESKDIDPKQTLVVVDDPSSSLDRESLYATHQWLLDSLDHVSQYIILTHDFGLLSLFLNSKGGHRRKITQQKSDNAEDTPELPKVSFLQCHTVEDKGLRTTRLTNLPDFLGKNASEYEYLFHTVMTTVIMGNADEKLAILPNAMRRILENFCAYKAPHQSDFRSRLEYLVNGVEDEPFEGVYRFINDFSHGTGDALEDRVDTMTIHRNLVHCLSFMAAVDEDHFIKLCQRVGLKREGRKFAKDSRSRRKPVVAPNTVV